MISDRELNELLQKVVAGGADPTYSPNEVDAFRASIPPEPMGTELPKGTKVVFAEGELDVAAPQSAAARMPIVPKVVDVPTSAQPSDEQLQAAYARAQDKRARQAMAMERGARELVAGLTRTQAQPVTQRPTDAFATWAQQQQQKQAAGQRADANRLAGDKVNFERQEAARKAALEEQKRNDDKARDERDFGYRKENDLANRTETERHHREDEKTGRISALKPRGPTVVLGADGRPMPTTYRDQLKADALKPRQGWEPIDPNAPTFRDPAQAKAFDSAVAAMGAIKNHRDHVLHAWEALRNAKTPKQADDAASQLNAQLEALSSKLREAEGFNNTDASNHAVQAMLGLKDGTALTFRNAFNQGRLPAILNAAIESGEANIDTLAESNNLRRAKVSGSSASKGEGPPRKTLKDGTVVEKHGDGLWYPVEDAED